MEKKADNSLYESSNRGEKYYAIDAQIDAEKSRINKLDDLEETMHSLKRSMDNVIEILGKSIKGGNMARKLGAIEDENNDSFSSVNNYIRNEKSNSESKIKELYKEKEKEEEEEKDKEE